MKIETNTMNTPAWEITLRENWHEWDFDKKMSFIAQQISLTEERVKDKMGNKLEWLRSRLDGHSLVQYPIKGRLPTRHEHFVSLDYVDARIDDLISVLGLTTIRDTKK